MAQSEDLCGGAAAAMVLRYWGMSDVQAEDFASLVDHARGGIGAADLVQALSSRGASVRSIRAEPADVVREIDDGRPVIALIDGGGGRLHYVVIVGWKNDRVLFHDPALGPFRVRSSSEFQRLWRVTDGFALLVTQKHRPPAAPERVPLSKPSEAGGACDALLTPAIATARGIDPEAAVPALVAASEVCPAEGGALLALAGVRFRQERWEESAQYARQALERDGRGEETWRLLGASLYLADRPHEALEAWNHIEEPRLDRVRIEGLVRTRQDLAAAVMGLRGRDVFTIESMALAERRAQNMPTFTNAKVTYRPTSSGRADVVATMGEARLTAPWAFLTARLAIKGVVRQELSLRINSPTGHGEGVELGGRFEDHRPAAWASIDTPRLAGLPGVISLSGLWDRQTYRNEPAAAGVSVETRRRGAASWNHWIRTDVRAEIGLAVDRFDGRGTFVSPRLGGEVRLAGDRAAIAGDLASWAGMGGGGRFSELDGTVALRSAVRPRRLLVTARVDGRRASALAPRAVWPGAGTGPGRPLLLRALPLLEDGELVGEAFGRGLLHASIEAELKVVDRGPARLGVAIFSDWARPWDTALKPGPGPHLFAFGAGLRLRTLSGTALRIDVAVSPSNRGLVLSGGVIPRWPR